MRSIIITAIILCILPFVFGRPRLGVLLWVWLSVMSPHKLSYGFANDFPFVEITAVVTLLSALFSKELKPPPFNALTILLISFTAWTGVTTIFAFYPEPSLVKFETMLKTQLLALLIPMLFRTREHLRQLIWVIVGSIAYYGIKGGAWSLLTGGGERVYGPPGSYLYENNALAVAVIMIIPLMRYLQLTSLNRKVRIGLVVGMLLCAAASLGSYSRGALLAAAAMISLLWLKGRHKIAFLVVAGIAIPMALNFMPQKWFDRMDTLNTYEEDSSASARLNSWMTMYNIANDRPVFGGGFVLDQAEIYQRYSPDPTRKAHVAHSIYFQALGEHGYVGLTLYLLLYFTAWRKASRIIRASKKGVVLQWAGDLSKMLQVSIIGFAVGGAFLSLVNFDVPYYLMGILVALIALVERETHPEKSYKSQNDYLPNTTYTSLLSGESDRANYPRLT